MNLICFSGLNQINDNKKTYMDMNHRDQVTEQNMAISSIETTLHKYSTISYIFRRGVEVTSLLMRH